MSAFRRQKRRACLIRASYRCWRYGDTGADVSTGERPDQIKRSASRRSRYRICDTSRADAFTGDTVIGRTHFTTLTVFEKKKTSDKATHSTWS